MLDPLIGKGMGGAGAIGPGGLGVPKPPVVGGGDGPIPFRDLLQSSIQRVNEMQEAAEKAKTAIATPGGAENIGEMMNSVKQAEIAFQELVEIRNKLVDAYQEVMRMQV